MNGAERADYDAYYRILNASPMPLQWDVPIGEGQRLTLRRFLYSLLDQHVNNDLRTDHIDWLLALIGGLLPGKVELPKNRQTYERLIAQLEDNTRFFLTCAAHCCPCSRELDRCPICNEPLLIGNKPAGIFYPRLWVAKLRSIPALAGALRYPVARQQQWKRGDPMEDVWDGTLFDWLTKRNAEPL